VRDALGLLLAVVSRHVQPSEDYRRPDQTALQSAIYVKPANGCGGAGVVRLERPDADALAQARNHDPADSYLIQRAVRPLRLDGDDGCERPAYLPLGWCPGEPKLFWGHPPAAVGPPPS